MCAGAKTKCEAREREVPGLAIPLPRRTFLTSHEQNSMLQLRCSNIYTYPTHLTLVGSPQRLIFLFFSCSLF